MMKEVFLVGIKNIFFDKSCLQIRWRVKAMAKTVDKPSKPDESTQSKANMYGLSEKSLNEYLVKWEVSLWIIKKLNSKIINWNLLIRKTYLHKYGQRLTRNNWIDGDIIKLDNFNSRTLRKIKNKVVISCGKDTLINHGN